MTARANPARLLKLAGETTTERVGRTRWAMWPLVEVLPYEPVTATTRGSTLARRAAAASTKWPPSFRSMGAVTRQARSTSAGTARATNTATPEAGPASAPAASTTTTSPALTAARVRSLRVQANGAVRPRSDSPSGPAATAAAVTTPATGHHHETAAAPMATAARSRLTGGRRHQRNANRETDPGR